MEVIASIVIILALICSFHPPLERPRDEIILPVTPPGIQEAVHYQRVKPLSAFKDVNLVTQQYDYSCGSAALATILNYYLGEDITEEEVIRGLMAYGDREQIERRRAFSLLDMKRFVDKLGFNVAGYTAEVADLKSLGMPCIVPINVFQYKHFVVFRGIYNEHVFLADPFLGNMSYTLTEFQDIWYRNIVLIISNGGNELDDLILTDDDLRLVEFNIDREFHESIQPRSVMIEQFNLLESAGKRVLIKEPR